VEFGIYCSVLFCNWNKDARQTKQKMDRKY